MNGTPCGSAELSPGAHHPPKIRKLANPQVRDTWVGGEALGRWLVSTSARLISHLMTSRMVFREPDATIEQADSLKFAYNGRVPLRGEQVEGRRMRRACRSSEPTSARLSWPKAAVAVAVRVLHSDLGLARAAQPIVHGGR